LHHEQWCVPDFIYSAGAVTRLNTFGGTNSCGFAINASGQVTGYADNAAGVPIAFRFTSIPTVTFTNLGALPASNWPFGGAATSPDSLGLAIDSSGNVAGASTGGGDLYFNTDWFSWMVSADDDTCCGPLGFLYSGSMQRVIPPSGPPTAWSVITGLSDSGSMVGVEPSNLCEDLCPQALAFEVPSGGTQRTLPAPSGLSFFFSAATGINATEEISGYGEDTVGHMHGFIYTGGATNDLGLNTEAYAINDSGQAVGLSSVALSHGVGLNSTASEFTLNGAADLNLPGAIPSGINDSGWIIANSPTLAHAYLLRPSAVSLSPTGLSFSNQALAAQTVTLTNSSADDIVVSPVAALAAPFSQTNDCPAALPAGASCVINVTATAVGTTTVAALAVSAGGVPFVTLLSDAGAIAVTVAASSTAVTAGSSVDLTWGAPAGSVCTASGGNGGSDHWSGPQPLSGTLTVNESAPGIYTYTLSCSSNTGIGVATAKVQVSGSGGGGGGSADPLLLLALGVVLYALASWRAASAHPAVVSPRAAAAAPPSTASAAAPWASCAARAS
jgi:probable HAF family extracellular repeat protein